MRGEYIFRREEPNFVSCRGCCSFDSALDKAIDDIYSACENSPNKWNILARSINTLLRRNTVVIRDARWSIERNAALPQSSDADGKFTLKVCFGKDTWEYVCGSYEQAVDLAREDLRTFRKYGADYGFTFEVTNGKICRKWEY